MEATIATTATTSKGTLWAGRIVMGLVTLFLLFDAVMKIFPNEIVIQDSAKLGWTASTLRPLGIVLLTSTILYVIPRTALLGAILLTAYLGGATASCILAKAGMNCLFPVVFGVVVWLGLILTHRAHRVFIFSTFR